MSVAKLYVVPASHPCATVMKALELKGVPYSRVDLVPAFHKLAQQARFGVATVPGIVFADGRKVSGSVAILRDLEAQRPDPPLYPDNPRVPAAEAWGDEILQPLVRRVLWHALTEDTAAQVTFMEGAKLMPPTPRPVAKLFAAPVALLERKINRSTPDKVRADLAALPAYLDKIDAWIDESVLGGDAINAADLQIAASLRLLLTLDDLVPVIDPRPAGELARRIFPAYPGRVGAGVLPTSA